MNFEEKHFTNAPAADEFELSIFGPGVGESLVMHLGDGDWYVIDSCRLPGEDSPVALAYLEAMNINPGDAIKGVLATHWHDDHVKGLSQIVRRCPDARFTMSAALASDEFNELVFEIEEKNKCVAASASSTASELADILERVADSKQSPPSYASDGSMLYRKEHPYAVELIALSPSGATIQNAFKSIASKLSPNSSVQKFTKLSPNDLSVAVQLSTPNHDLLLKADLENCKHPHQGWNAVLKSAVRPKKQSSVVKVGHHGSSNADSNEVWQNMVLPNATGVVTPYSKLRSPLPSGNDVARIKKRGVNLNCTTWPPSVKPPRRRGVDGAIFGAVKSRRALNRRPGFIRLRFSLIPGISAISVERFGSATQL
ncbi:MBL fold metallo-hydrolase [Bremerella sp. JC817]|uniref:MBL fold metallo-hydrolase n=1 Tax=Bremerella sp. JC817 TaxID=3231756 RepID=UPI00345A048A